MPITSEMSFAASVAGTARRVAFSTVPVWRQAMPLKLTIEAK